jgi:hypothetical protein
MQRKKKFPQEIKNICLCSPFDAIKKPLSSSLSRLFATALFFIGLTLTMTPPPSSVIVLADDAQGTASSDYHFITTSAAASSISLSIEDEDETEDEDEEDEEESPLRVAFVKYTNWL